MLLPRYAGRHGAGVCADTRNHAHSCTHMSSLSHVHRSEPHLALTALCTMWLMMGIRERSNELMMQAFSCATRCGIAMDAILDAQGTPHAVDGSLAGLAALLFTPGHLQPIEIDTPLGVSQIPPEICATVGRTQDTINEGWVLVRTHSRGRMRIFASQAFERDIVTWDTLMTNFRKGDRPCIELVLPQVECGKCMHTLGELVGHAKLRLLAARSYHTFNPVLF
jgi:hypothetical protein